MTTPLFTLDAILDATGGRAEGVEAREINSISIDSRELGPDALFVAIKGDRFDGHDFVDAALANGAVAALVSEGCSAGPGRIFVADALGGLRDLGRAARARSRALIVGVTGSVGKTTTKEALRVVFEAAGQTHASIKSFNNHWGVPLMLARMPANTQFGVFEMGMNAPEEIRPLSQMVRPHVAVITSIAPVHLEGLGSIEAIARAKAEIFSGVEPGGTAIINADHGQLPLLLDAAAAANIGNVITYGFARGVDWQILDPQSSAERSSAKVQHLDRHCDLDLPIAGRHMLANATAALAAAHVAGIRPEDALRALAGLRAQAGRGQQVLLGPVDTPLLLVNESYNANPVAVVAALSVFAAIEPRGGRKVLVLGDMRELGAEADALHAGLADAVRESGAERVHLVGQHMAALASALPAGLVTSHAQTAEQAEDVIVADLAYGDAIMIKGSNGVGLARIVSAIVARFEQT
ncbi:UDP-N-acetylmuramoyl-tripeptide--D-alanyl-D-alanine ligase [Devosia faecipullorum]|uniref:UDP-N-acetylmuramoyl-tripeptide--D-alanyl-D- alanine ligase n=1 Tax=Devosia faecipullorum TaxID=2755039 RepID=UPI00187B2278|nr:UDP-N-acetylmuramoyl-tripeptide--D-alanyl-D-alanine ligase [Devosia faecipullorum]MBE7732262.1 UDP-N-acetylmuramoyl-tripeptide--D-alanyl-D-alanine ligase [Devosia faecipullorum]